MNRQLIEILRGSEMKRTKARGTGGCVNWFWGSLVTEKYRWDARPQIGRTRARGTEKDN